MKTKNQLLKQFLIAVGLLTMTMLYAAETPTIINLKPTDVRFQVNLPTNPSTGYQWKINNYDQQLLRLISSEYASPESSAMGAPGEMQFIFEVIERGVMPKFTAIVFKYVRPWEKEEGKVKVITVNFRQSPSE